MRMKVLGLAALVLMALIVSIALAAIALLTKKKWLEYAMFGAGAVGVVVGILAALHL